MGVCSVKKCIARSGNKSGVLQQKHLVQLDWAPTEDGSHILTVAVGSKVLFLAPANKDIINSTDLRLHDGLYLLSLSLCPCFTQRSPSLILFSILAMCC